MKFDYHERALYIIRVRKAYLSLDIYGRIDLLKRYYTLEDWPEFPERLEVTTEQRNRSETLLEEAWGAGGGIDKLTIQERFPGNDVHRYKKQRISGLITADHGSRSLDHEAEGQSYR